MANPLESIRRKLLSVANGDRHRDSQSLHRFVLLKNSLTLAQNPQPALPEPEEEEEEEEEVDEGVVDAVAVEDSFVFPDVSSFQSGASTQDAEREWLDGLLEGLEDDEDDDDASILSSSACFDDELPSSPTSTAPAAVKSFYPPPLSPPFQLSLIPYTGPIDPRPTSFSSHQPLADDPDDDLRPPSLQADDGDDESDITDGPLTPYSISTCSLPRRRRVSETSLRDDTGIFVEQLSSYFSPYDIDDPPSDNSCC